MRAVLQNLLGRILRPKPEGLALRPLDLGPAPLYVIGDLHGCLAQLQGLCEIIKQDAAQYSARPKLLFLGDMIDRGPQTSGVLDYLLSRPLWADLLCLRGNHEEMMLAFLKAPRRNLAWLDYGGFETLRSYGLALPPAELRQLSDRRAQQILLAHIPHDHIDFLHNLPHGHYADLGGERWVFTHAGYDPARPLSAQSPADLLWARHFSSHRDSATTRLVFGHFVQETIDLQQKWIGIDSGAYLTGCLTALRLTAEGPPRALQYKAKAFLNVDDNE